MSFWNNVMKPSISLLSELRGIFLACLCLASTAALADPAARVGRIAIVEGAVDFRSTDQSEPVPAAINWPLTAANVVTTASGARTELRVGSTVVRLNGQSELHVLALDDARVDLYLAQGSMTVRLRNPEIVREFSLQTPQGRIVLQQPGRLRIDTGHGATSAHAIDGMARFDATGTAQGGVLLAAGSVMESRDGVSRITDLQAPRAFDAFDAWALARDGSDDHLASARYVSPETTGYEELDRHGVWRESAEYGAVWIPSVVAPGWAPYRSGRWLWVAPWGWTWIDNAPWGYAPSHYGRWVSIDSRWCWTPGAVVARPVWAPALVGWRGAQNWNLVLHASSPPSGGWFPLAPREVYVPPYPVSRTYVQQVNITQNISMTQVNRFYRERPAGGGWQRQAEAQQAAGVVQPAALLRQAHVQDRRVSPRGREVPATPAAAAPAMLALPAARPLPAHHAEGSPVAPRALHVAAPAPLPDGRANPAAGAAHDFGPAEQRERHHAGAHRMAHGPVHGERQAAPHGGRHAEEHTHRHDAPLQR